MKFEIEVVGGKPTVVDNQPTAAQLMLINHLYSQQEVPFLSRQKPETKREAEILITELERKKEEVEDLEARIVELEEEIDGMEDFKYRIASLEQELEEYKAKGCQ